jgi:hypothetical protein
VGLAVRGFLNGKGWLGMGAEAQKNQHDEAEPVTSTPAASGTAPVRHDPEHATEASGPKGDNPSTAGPGATGVDSRTPENQVGHLNPSAPEDSNTTPGTTGEK